MNSQLPPNFPIAGLGSGDISKIEWFYQRYVDEYYDEYRYGHFILAAYAAVPALITPDLLYKIWQNFNGYKWAGETVLIHRVAVSDILLSPMCREVGFELFEMNSAIRFALLKWLSQEAGSTIWKKRELRTVNELAAFVEEYHQLPNAALHRWGRDYSELQLVEAISFTRPEQAAAILLTKLQAAAEEQRENELMRTMDRFIQTGHRLHFVHSEETAPEILAYYNKQGRMLEAWAELIQENSEGFVERLRTDKTLMKNLTTTVNTGIPVKISGSAAEKFEQLTGKKTRLIVAGGSSRERRLPEYGDLHLNNSKYMHRALRENFNVPDDLVVVLTESNFTRHSVLQVLSSVVSAAEEQDQLIIYFSAECKQVEGNDYLECYDSDPGFSDMNGWISAGQVHTILSRANCASVTLILQLDAVAPSLWLDITDDRNIVFHSGKSGAVLQSVQQTVCNHFTLAFADIISTVDDSDTYRDVFLRLIKNIPGTAASGNTEEENNYAYRPMMFGTRSGYKRNFKGENSSMIRLQNLLRETAFLQQPSTGKWNTATAEALALFAKQSHIDKKESRQYFISRLEEFLETQEANAFPVWLFVFADPAQRLKFIEKEKYEVQDILSAYGNQLNFETIIPADPDKKKIKDIFSDPVFRNRIQLVYLAGNDEQGDLVFSDGALTLEEFGDLLDYQDRIDMLILNTCRSDAFAAFATQLGVRYAFGINGEIEDEVAMRSGIHIIEKIFREVDLNEIFPQFYR